MLIQHLPALQIFVPFFGGFLIAILKSRKIFFLSCVICLMISIQILRHILTYSVFAYSFGGFNSFAGVEFIIDSINAPLLLVANIVLFGTATIMRDIDYKNASLGLICYGAIFGILMTADIFNLYVFLEIYSITASILFVMNGVGPQNGLRYLIINTIAATLILLSIGFLLASSGNLNMFYMKMALVGKYGNKLIMAGCVLFAIGALCKALIFPLHFWIVAVYENSKNLLLLLLTPISSAIGFYILIRFAYFAVDYQKFFAVMQNLMQIIGGVSLVISAIIAFMQTDLRKTMIWSAVNSSSYLLILFSIPEADALQYASLYLTTDILSKFLIFYMVLHTEETYKNSRWNFMLFCLILLNSAGIPLSIGFFNKIHFLRIALYSTPVPIFCCAIIASTISVMYHYNILHLFLFNNASDDNERVEKGNNLLGKYVIGLIVLLLYIIILYHGLCLEFYAQSTNVIFDNQE